MLTTHFKDVGDVSGEMIATAPSDSAIRRLAGASGALIAAVYDKRSRICQAEIARAVDRFEATQTGEELALAG